jgi:hypothetical protein
MNEADFMRRCMKRATDAGARLFRNNVGKAWIGKDEEIRATKTVLVHKGDVVIRQARRFHAGLAEGSGDLIGFVPVVITPEMVGSTIAQFASPETKTATGRVTKEQRAWIAMVIRFGGRAGIVRTDDDLDQIIGVDHDLAPPR